MRSLLHRIKDFVDSLRKEPSHLGVDVSGTEQTTPCPPAPAFCSVRSRKQKYF